MQGVHDTPLSYKVIILGDASINQIIKMLVKPLLSNSI